MPAARPIAAGRVGWSSRRTGIAVAVAAGAYGTALVATLPASLVAPRGSDAAGTVWHGSANVGVGAGGAVARWDVSLAASLASASLAAQTTVEGPASVVTGMARWRPFAPPAFTDIRGRAGWAQLAAAVPALAAECTIVLALDLARVTADNVSGSVTTLPGTCLIPGRGPQAVPRLVATFGGTTGVVTSWTDRATPLATATFAGSRIRLHVTPAGAAVLPGPGRAGDVEFEL